MIAYYLKSAVRSILGRKLYSSVSITGLAIGMTVSMLIFSFVRYEAGFDAMHPHNERTFRLNWASAGAQFATFFNPLTPELAANFPEVEAFTRLAIFQHLVGVENNGSYQSVAFVDPGFLELFHYETLAGDPVQALGDLNSAILTEAAALLLFGDIRPLGRVFNLDGSRSYRVSAIIANNPGNSHLISNIYLAIDNLPLQRNNPQFWDNRGSDVMYHYIRLEEGTDPTRMRSLFETYIDETTFPQAQVPLQPLRDIHFTRDLQNEMSTIDPVLGTMKPLRDRTDILIFAGVGILTLAIALFNFMNLQVAQFTRRAREVGIRRIAGSSRAQLAFQFLLEASLISLAAMLLALLLTDMTLPWFNNVVAASPDTHSFFNLWNVLLLLGLSLVLGVIAGAYPAVTVASLSPSDALRGQVIRGVSAGRFRSGLIVLQFSISIGLIIASGIVSTQIDYAMNKSLGFDPQHVVTVELPGAEARRAYALMRSQLEASPGIRSVSAANIIPTRDLSDGGGFVREGGDPDAPLLTRAVVVDNGYFETLGMEMVAGRSLSDDYPSDRGQQFSMTVTQIRGALVLNETAARAAGWTDPQEAIGQGLYFEGQFQGLQFRADYTVVGVVRDTHFQSIRTEIQPMSFTLVSNPTVMIVRLEPDNQLQGLAAIDNIWQSALPELPIQRAFLTQSYNAFYASEGRTFVLFIALTGIAIAIACVGLYALASYIAERRTKEISIRKVLGATVRSLAALLAWDFSRLVILANLIAWPLAWWAMQQWLTNFAYRTDISLFIFLVAGVATFGIALATTFQRAYTVANTNPAQVLRAE